MAPPMPCRKRPRIRTPPDGAVAATRLAPTKTTTPVAKSRRRPHTSPVWPRVIKRAAKTSEYIELNHSAVVALTWSSRMIVGIATLTIVASTMIIETPSATKGIGSHFDRPVACRSSVGAFIVELLEGHGHVGP